MTLTAVRSYRAMSSVARMELPPSPHISDLLSRYLSLDAVTERATEGLRLIKTVPSMDAWWLVVDVLARNVLPLTLEDIPGSYSNELLKKNAAVLVDIAAQLRSLAPLPHSLPDLVPLLHLARPVVLSRFLDSFEAALSRPGDLYVSGALEMALFRWPSKTSSGHFMHNGGGFWASLTALEVIAHAQSPATDRSPRDAVAG